MCLLFETIRVENGVPLHLAWHQRRMNRSVCEIWGETISFALKPVILIQDEFLIGSVRCNIMYGPDIRSIAFKKYEKRIIRSLKLVYCDTIDYHLKYTDREVLQSLFMLRGASDEIIVVKNGMITDSSISNLIFFDGKNWFTPAKPLLKGTCRDRLVDEGRLIERDIPPGDIDKFTGCKLINAMRDPDEEDLIPMYEIT